MIETMFVVARKGRWRSLGVGCAAMAVISRRHILWSPARSFQVIQQRFVALSSSYMMERRRFYFVLHAESDGTTGALLR